MIYIGRFFLAPGVVGLLDRLLADPGKLKEFRNREKAAAEAAARAAAIAASGEAWPARVAQVKKTMLTTRMQQVTLKDGSRVTAPWQYRNCAMGGRHTEKEYPESNISMQESMFMPLSAKTYEDSQEMTVKLQSRLKEIIESAPGAKVMGVGLEGGIAPYIDKEPTDQVPEQRMWRFMKQAILDCELVPGVDVAIALDPACSELENAYREERGEPDSIGMYRFWRDKGKVEMSRDQMLNLFKQSMEQGIPILSIEDGFGERDHQGWQNIMKELGDKIFIIGDDLVTTKDSNIEKCAKNGEINAVSDQGQPDRHRYRDRAGHADLPGLRRRTGGFPPVQEPERSVRGRNRDRDERRRLEVRRRRQHRASPEVRPRHGNSGPGPLLAA